MLKIFLIFNPIFFFLLHSMAKPPTFQDSLDLYKNSLEVYEYYNNDKYNNKLKYVQYITAGKDNIHELNIKALRNYKHLIDEKAENYQVVINEYKYLQREHNFKIIDKNAPLVLYDTRIPIHKVIYVHNQDKYDEYYRDVVNIPLYDPILVKPASLLNDEEKIYRARMENKLHITGNPTAIKTDNEKEVHNNRSDLTAAAEENEHGVIDADDNEITHYLPPELNNGYIRTLLRKNSNGHLEVRYRYKCRETGQFGKEYNGVYNGVEWLWSISGEGTGVPFDFRGIIKNTTALEKILREKPGLLSGL